MLGRGQGLGWACCPQTPPALYLLSVVPPCPATPPKQRAHEASWSTAVMMLPRGRPWWVQRGGVGHPGSSAPPRRARVHLRQTRPAPQAPLESGVLWVLRPVTTGRWPDSETSARLWGWRLAWGRGSGEGASCLDQLQDSQGSEAAGRPSALVFRVPVSPPPCLSRILVLQPGPSVNLGRPRHLQTLNHVCREPFSRKVPGVRARMCL